MELPSESESDGEGMLPSGSAGHGALLPSAPDDVDMLLPGLANSDDETSAVDELVLPSSSSSSDDAVSGGRLPLPPFGSRRAFVGDVVRDPAPTFELVQPLRVDLRAPLLPRGVMSRSSALRASWIVHYCGTLRRFPATHSSCGYLSDRNKHELPQCIFYSGQFQDELRRIAQHTAKMAASPQFCRVDPGPPRRLDVDEPVVGRGSASSCREGAAASCSKNIVFCRCFLDAVLSTSLCRVGAPQLPIARFAPKPGKY